MISEGISDHRLVFSSLEFPEIKANRQVNTVLSFSAADDTAMIDYLDLRLSDSHAKEDIRLLWDQFKTIVHTCISKYVARRRKRTQRNDPWITRNIIHIKRAITRKRSNTCASLLSLLTQTQKIKSEKLVNFSLLRLSSHSRKSRPINFETFCQIAVRRLSPLGSALRC